MKKREPTCWRLRNEDITSLGGPMGTESVSDRYTKYYATMDAAIRAAEKEYGQPIDWKKYKGGYHSPDLLHTMYYVEPVYVEPLS